PERGFAVHEPGTDHRAQLRGMPILLTSARDGGYEEISQRRGQRHECGQDRRADRGGRSNVAQGAPVRPAGPAIQVASGRLIEILPPPEIEQAGRIVGEAGGRPALRSTFDKPQQARLAQKDETLRRIDRHRTGVPPLQNGHAREIKVRTLIMCNLKPREAPVGTLPYTASTRKMTGDVPRAVVEVAGIAGPEVVAVDHAPIEPELPESLDVVRAVEEVTVVRNFELVRAAFHRVFPPAPTTRVDTAQLAADAARGRKAMA